MNRLSDTQSLAIVHAANAYLFEKFSHEKGLFQTSASQTQVRNLQTQMVQGI